MSDYTDIILRLESATGPDAELDGLIGIHGAGMSLERRGSDRKAWYYDDAMACSSRSCPRYNSDLWGPGALPRYTASLDAVIALVERALPEWRVTIQQRGSGWAACLWLDPSDGPDTLIDAIGPHPNPALALLLALFRALQAQEDQRGAA